ncbi:hypothetical protein EDD17DRAFT_1611673 [Pisolithus thermaeus]|nr:hypothetical protein EDD17DRAFT_1611673 [Pisolithus thermaeus]
MFGSPILSHDSQSLTWCLHGPSRFSEVRNLQLSNSLAMAALTMTSMRRPFGTTSPYVSSPLAGSSHTSSASPGAVSKLASNFPQSRPLRPFASLSQNTSKRPVKIIEPPKNFKTTFILDLTQGEFSRQD